MTEVEERDDWSWSKFAKGPFVGKNYAKAFVLLICILVILTIFSSIGFAIYTAINRFGKPRLAPVTPDNVTATTATIDKSQTTSEATHNESPLSRGIISFNFGSTDKKVVKSK